MSVPGDIEATTRAALEEKIMGPHFSCVAGKTAWLRSTVEHCALGVMATSDATTHLHRRLVDFVARRDDIDPLLATFAATFTGPAGVDEDGFEALLWQQLQMLHSIDVTRFGWDPAVDVDPASPRFGFSVAGHGFFVVGLHPNASRISRRFGHPTLVFNSHLQFERLKERGMYEQIKGQVRRRELALQGSLNPNLADFGDVSEAKQYSGREVPPEWRCPFQPAVAEGRVMTRAAER